MRRPTAKDIRMLTDVRERVRQMRIELLPHPLTRENMRLLGYDVDPPPLDCNHDVPWTECTTCSKARRK